MDCYNCNTKLIWGGDLDIEDDDSEYAMETNLSCPECNTAVLVYTPIKK